MTDDTKSRKALVGLGQWLGQLRERAGYSQWEFAPLTGYSRSSLSDAELGRHLLHRDFWVAADKALKMNGQLVAAWELVVKLRHEERTQRRKERQENRRAEQGVLVLAPGVSLCSMTLVWSDGSATILNTQVPAGRGAERR